MDEAAPRRLWRRYEDLLAERPLLVKALTSFIGFAIGDVLTQCFIQRSRFSAFRLLRLASFGFLLHGPSSHYFYGALDARIPGTSASIVATKVAIDQLFWSPCFSVLFFGYTGALELQGLPHMIEKIQAESFAQVTGSWHVWPAAHAINFRMVPTEQRILFINTVQVAYNCFLSVLANHEAGSESSLPHSAVHSSSSHQRHMPHSRGESHVRARRHARRGRAIKTNTTAQSGTSADPSDQ